MARNGEVAPRDPRVGGGGKRQRPDFVIGRPPARSYAFLDVFAKMFEELDDVDAPAFRAFPLLPRTP